MSTISTEKVTKLFTDLVKAANENTEQGKKEFIRIMKEHNDEFNQPIGSTLANGNTINHSIARAISVCNNSDCALCTKKDAKFGVYPLVTKFGEAPYIVFKYINDNDDVKEEYKRLFSNSYATTENYHEKKYTPLDFAKTCNPEFAEYMMIKLVPSLANPPATTNENKPEPVKDEDLRVKYEDLRVKYEDLTVPQLEAKIEELEKQTKITHTIVGPLELTTSMKEKITAAKDIEENNTKISKEQNILKDILKEKTKEKTKKSALSMAKRVFGKKGGKTRKHKKTNKRRTYRRK